MPAGATVDLSGLTDHLGRALAPPSDYGPLLRQVTELLRQRTRDCFDGSHDPEGRPWRPLKRPRRGGGGKPLIDTGLLRLSVGVTRQGPLEIAFGSTVPYAAYHQFGTRRIPTRPFLGIGAETADRIAELTADFVRGELLRR